MSEPSHKTLPIDETLLRKLLDGTFEGILIHDRLVHYANAAAARLTGRTVDDLVGAAVRDLGVDALQEDALGSPTAEASFGPAKFTVRAAGGARPRSIEVQGRVIELHGTPLWLSAFRDVTNREVSRERLLKRVEFEDLITQIAADFIGLEPSEVAEAIDGALRRIGEFADVDRSYVYLIEGEAMVAANIWARSGTVSRSLFRNWTVPTRDFAWAIDKLRRDEAVVYETEETYRFDEAGNRIDTDQARTRSSCCVPMLVRDDLIGYLGFDLLQDDRTWDEDTKRLLRTVGYILAQLLHRKQAQEELRCTYATMEEEIARRREELEHQHLQLLHAEKMASLGALVAGVAHEINTPLGAIKSNTDTLARSLKRIEAIVEEPDQLAQHSKRFATLLGSCQQLNQINVQAIDRITAIVQSLRRFARLDRAEVATIDLHDTIDDTLTLVRHELKHRVDVVREYGELPQIECYPDQINQVCMNLLVNASQAIEKRGTIRIATRAVGDDAVQVAVTDDGRGIPPENQRRVFDPGFTTKGVGVGTGLGLSIVQRIVDAHHGRIELDSKVGAGSTFRVILPIRQPSPNESTAG